VAYISSIYGERNMILMEHVVHGKIS
jgi:hypothetical protein